MAELDYKDILCKIRPTKKDLWAASIGLVLFGILWTLSMFEIFGTKSEIIAILTGLFTANWFGRFTETVNLRKKINNALKGKMAT